MKNLRPEGERNDVPKVTKLVSSRNGKSLWFRMLSPAFVAAEAKKTVMAQGVKTFNFSDTLTFIAHLLSHRRK